MASFNWCIDIYQCIYVYIKLNISRSAFIMLPTCMQSQSHHLLLVSQPWGKPFLLLAAFLICIKQWTPELFSFHTASNIILVQVIFRHQVGEILRTQVLTTSYVTKRHSLTLNSLIFVLLQPSTPPADNILSALNAVVML